MIQIKVPNFEGPFDLLFHLIEKNKINLYDIPIHEITDQYMEYLFAMREMDLEIASEFLVMASTLLHIKSRMLLPDRREKPEDEPDPREELVMKLIEYKKYKEFAQDLRKREKEWEKVFYKLPELVEIRREDEVLELSPEKLERIYSHLLDRNARKRDRNVHISQIIPYEKVSLREKMKEILKFLIKRPFVRFSELFSIKRKSRMEVVTGFLAILELAKLKKIVVEQEKPLADIHVLYKLE